MEPQHVERYLRERLPGVAGLELVRLHRTYPGMSRETWLADTRWRENGQDIRRGFVLRMDTPGGSVCPTPLRREYEVYRRLDGTAVPVPRALWYETDAGWLTGGREFYVRDKIEGNVDIPNLHDPAPAYDRLRLEVAREHISKLAALHTLDWRLLGFADVLEVPPDEARCARFDLDLWEDTFDRVRPEAYPVIREVFCWLKDNPPPPAPRISLVKGNNGVGEEIWQGTRIVGMSDWELAHLGDPTEDWTWMQLNPRVGTQGIGGLFDEGRLRELYEEASGIPLREESLHYYHLVHTLKALVCTVTAASMTVGEKDLRASTVGMGLLPYQGQAALARAIGLMSSSAPPPLTVQHVAGKTR